VGGKLQSEPSAYRANAAPCPFEALDKHGVRDVTTILRRSLSFFQLKIKPNIFKIFR
jgi:hypothetical protein